MTRERMKADDFPKEVLTLFDRYVHGLIDRPAFLDGAAKFAVGGMTAAAFLEALSPRYAWAAQVPEDDSRVAREYIEYDSPNGSGTMRGYLASPRTVRLPGRRCSSSTRTEASTPTSKTAPDASERRASWRSGPTR